MTRRLSHLRDRAQVSRATTEIVAVGVPQCAAQIFCAAVPREKEPVFRRFIPCRFKEIAARPIPAGKWSVSAANQISDQRYRLIGEIYGMSIVQDRADSFSAAGPHSQPSSTANDDPVSHGLRESARRMIGIAVFSGVINILMLSGSVYMLQVYDRVIPSRNIATLFGLSLMVLFAYLMQGYFDALRARMLCRVATLFDAGLQESIHTALATLPLRGVKPMLMQQPLRDLDQIRSFMSSMGPTAFLDMPWIPIFLIALFLFHPAIGMTALAGTAAIIAMTLVTERMSRGAAKAAMDSSAQRQVLADA